MRTAKKPLRGLELIRVLHQVRVAAKLIRSPGLFLLAALAAVSVAGGLIPVAYALLARVLIDSLIGHHSHAVVGALLGILGISVVANLVPAFGTYIQSAFSRKLQMTVETSLFGAVMDLPGLETFEDPEFLDRLGLARQGASSGPIQLLGGVTSGIQGVITVGGFVVSLLALDPWLAVLIFGAGLPNTIGQLYIGRETAAVMLAVMPLRRRMIAYGLLQIDVGAAQEIRLFGFGRFLLLRMRGALVEANDRQRSLSKRTLLVSSVFGVVSAAAAGGALIILIHGALTHRFSVGDVTLGMAGLVALAEGIGVVIAQIGAGRQALALLEHYNYVIELSRIKEVGVVPAARCGDLESEIVFDNVWFRYDESQPWVLRGLSLTIRAGQTLAIVGSNGAGKTTLVKLLSRMYAPDRGVITWDGVDIQRFDVGEYRSFFSAVFQNFVKYDLSARENIAVGSIERGAELGVVLDAAQAAGVDEAIQRLQYGYDTMLSRLFFDTDNQKNATTQLSEGQWQRVAIARALMRNECSVIVLDEPSSGLDPLAEQAIHSKLKSVRDGRTNVLISHRLSTSRDADVIVVLADGGVAEVGTHDELVKSDGLYAQMFTTQASGYQA